MPNDEGENIFIYSLSASKHPKCNLDKLSQIQTLEKNMMMRKPNGCRAASVTGGSEGSFEEPCWVVGGDDIQAATQLTGMRFRACTSTFQMMALLRGENRSFCLLAEFTDTLFLLLNHEKGLCGFWSYEAH